MKLGGVLNHRLSMVIAEMGHTDGLTIADAGLPVPLGVERIDLAVSPGVPSFAQVLAAVASELKIEEIVIAKEAFDRNPDLLPTLERCSPKCRCPRCRMRTSKRARERLARSFAPANAHPTQIAFCAAA